MCWEWEGQYLKRFLRYRLSSKDRAPIFPDATSPESLLDSLWDESFSGTSAALLVRPKISLAASRGFLQFCVRCLMAVSLNTKPCMLPATLKALLAVL